MARLLETAAVTAATLALALALGKPVVWAFVPVILLLVLRVEPEAWGLRLRLSPPPLARQLPAGIGLLLGYAALHLSIAVLVFGARFSPAFPRDPAGLVLSQLLVVAIPEELFFRGYVQSRLNGAFRRRWRLLGARVGPSLFVQAAFFALCHLPAGDWTRLRVFFFGLLAGWLRDRSGGVLLPVLYHVIANVWLATIVASLR